MLPHDYLQRLRQVEVRARVVSEQLMGGRLTSVFKGRGMDFADVREYVAGDDVRFGSKLAGEWVIPLLDAI